MGGSNHRHATREKGESYSHVQNLWGEARACTSGPHYDLLSD